MALQQQHPCRKLLMLLASTAVLLVFLSVGVQFSASVFDPPDPLTAELMETSPSCFRRPYTYKVKQEDSEGRSCWDSITVYGCWGRCDSNEIADWRFPFKRSYHPVCQHEEIIPLPVILQHCDPEVEPGTEIYVAMEAQTCRCQLCKTDGPVLCEGLHPAVDRRLSPSRRSHN